MVYYATGVRGNDFLYKEIVKLNKYRVEIIGDAKRPATIMEAIDKGYKVANRI